MEKVLIVKLGAMGDVIRTTPLLHILNGDVFWVTSEECLPLLPPERITSIVEAKKAKSILQKVTFDLVLSLDDDCHAAAIATALKKQTLIGSYLNGDGMPAYTDSSAEWFDKGLISRFGKNKADILKMKNTKTYQEIIFEMLGRKFSGEDYILNSNGIAASYNKSDELLVGIERNAGSRWPMKRWNKYDELAQLLISKGFNTTFFQQKKHIAQYIQDINDCDIIVCGDTLAMHVALALKKKVVAIFICTSPTEIYGYGRMTKVVSPLLEQFFYKTNYVHEAVDSISVEQVYRAVEKISRTLNENTICHKCLPVARS